MSDCIHCVVSGRVQGVFYRAATCEMAMQLGVKGWICNMPDGAVELEACGTPDQIGKLYKWLWQGSPHAKVTDVSCETVDGSDIGNSFSVRY